MATNKEEIIGMNFRGSGKSIPEGIKTITEIGEEKSIKINNLEQYAGPVMLYNSVADKLSKYGKKRGTNLTPKKKKRKR